MPLMTSLRGRLGVTVSMLALASAAAAGCGDDGDGTGGSGGEGTGGEATGGQNTGGGGGQTGGGGAGGGSATQGPIDAPADTWTWVDFPDAQCMDGSPTGIGINPHPTSDDVVIFLMGGNACFNNVSCAITANTDGYGAAKFENESVRDSALWDRTDPNNPLRDFSYVFVPYCTGDVFAGDRADVMIGNKTWQFHGFRNMGEFLERLVPTFPNAQRVLLAGVSAGGFGAAYNYDQVATAFGSDVNVVLVDDSGPPMAEAFVPACLQQHFMDTWGLAGTLPADCADCGVGGVFTEPMMDHIISKYAGRSLGLISSEEDATIRQFWSFGNDDCANLSFPSDYDGALYTQGLVDLRDRVAGPDSSFRLFMMPGDEHVFLDNDLGSVTRDGVTLQTWLEQALAGEAGWPNVPAPTN